MPEFEPSTVNPAQTKRELRFVFIGRLDINHKGLDLLLDACAMIQADLRQACAQIHLYGPDSEGSRDTLNQMILSHQMQDFVHVHDSVFADEKQAVLRKTDLFLHTSRFEGHPMSVLEALAYGVPCLVTPGTNVAPIVAEAGAGWAVGQDVASIAAGLKAVLASPEQLQSKRPAARRLAQQEYSWEKVGHQMLAEYQKILARN